MNLLQLVLLATAVLIVVSLFWGLIKKMAVKATTLAVNSLLGLTILFVLDRFLGFHIPIAIPTIIVCALFGLPGVTCLAILHLFGYI